MQGKLAEAEPLLERSQAIREKSFGQENPDVAESLNTRALLLHRQVRASRAPDLKAEGRVFFTNNKALWV